MPVQVGPVVVGHDRVAEQRRARRRRPVRGRPARGRAGGSAPARWRPARRRGRPAAVGVADLGEEQPQVAVGADLGVERPEPLLELGSTHDPIHDVPDAAGRRQQLEAVAGLDEGGVVGEAVVAQLVVGADEGVLEQPQRAPVGQGVGVRVVGAGEPGGIVGAEEGVEAGGRRRGGARRRPRPRGAPNDHDVAEHGGWRR